jgi:hypothetical protein
MAPYNTYAYCNPGNPIQVRVADLVSRMMPIDFEVLLDSSNPGYPIWAYRRLTLQSVSTAP